MFPSPAGRHVNLSPCRPAGASCILDSRPTCRRLSPHKERLYAPNRESLYSCDLHSCVTRTAPGQGGHASGEIPNASQGAPGWAQDLSKAKTAEERKQVQTRLVKLKRSSTGPPKIRRREDPRHILRLRRHGRGARPRRNCSRSATWPSARRRRRSRVRTRTASASSSAITAVRSSCSTSGIACDEPEWPSGLMSGRS